MPTPYVKSDDGFGKLIGSGESLDIPMLNVGSATEAVVSGDFAAGGFYWDSTLQNLQLGDGSTSVNVNPGQAPSGSGAVLTIVAGAGASSQNGGLMWIRGGTGVDGGAGGDLRLDGGFSAFGSEGDVLVATDITFTNALQLGNASFAGAVQIVDGGQVDINATVDGSGDGVLRLSAITRDSGDITLSTTTSGNLLLNPFGTITAFKSLIFDADNTHDIGASGATRPRTVYVGTSVVTPQVSSPTSTNLDLAPSSGQAVTITSTNTRGLQVVGNAAAQRGIQILNSDGDAGDAVLELTAGTTATLTKHAETGGTSESLNINNAGGDLNIKATTAGWGVFFGTSNTRRWGFDSDGHFSPWTSNVYDLGTTSKAPRTIYIGTSLNVGSGITPSTSNGDLVVGNGTTRLHYDADVDGGTLYVGTASNPFNPTGKIVLGNVGSERPGGRIDAGVETSTGFNFTANDITSSALSSATSLRMFAGSNLSGLGAGTSSSNAGAVELHGGDTQLTNGSGGGVLLAAGQNLNGGTHGYIILRTDGATRWQVSGANGNAGHLIAGTDNSYDIGSEDGGTTSLRPRTIYAGTQFNVSSSVDGNLTAGFFKNTSAGTSAVSFFRVRNNADNDVYLASYGSNHTTNANRAVLFTNNQELRVGTAHDLPVTFETNNADRWIIQNNTDGGHFVAATDNTYDVGNSGALRPRTGYFGTSLNVGNGITPSTNNGDIVAGDATNSLSFTTTTPSLILRGGSSTGTTVLRVRNDLNNDGFLSITGSTTGFPNLVHYGANNCTVRIGPSNDFQLDYVTGNTARWAVQSPTNGGHFVAAADNTYDVGNSGALRPRTGYFGTSLNVGNGITPSTNNGDLVAGDGTRAAQWVASTATLSLTGSVTASFRAPIFGSLDGASSVDVRFGSGNASAGNSGNVGVDAGSATATAGTVTIGGTSASGITIGRSGITTDFPSGSTVDFTGATVTGLTTGGFDFLNVGSATSASATGDLAASDGTNEMLWDPSANTLSLTPPAGLNTTTFTMGDLGEAGSVTFSTPGDTGATLGLFTITATDAVAAGTAGTWIDAYAGNGNGRNGGAIRLTAGDTNDIIRAGGGLFFNTGDNTADAAFTAGTISFWGPNLVTDRGAQFQVQAGNGIDGGPAAVLSGDGTTGNGGGLTLFAGNSTSGGNGGSTVLAAGTGTTNGSIYFRHDTTTRLQITANGHLVEGTDNSYDFGSDDGGTTPLRPRTIYVGTSVIVAGALTANSTGLSSTGAITLSSTGALSLDSTTGAIETDATTFTADAALTVGTGAGSGLTLSTGNNGAGASGNIVIDPGTASTTTGTITIGNINASAVEIVGGSSSATVSLGNSVAGNINLTSGGSITLDASSTGGEIILTSADATWSVIQSVSYAPTNVTLDRTFDADAANVNEIADILGTLILDLQAAGILG